MVDESLRFTTEGARDYLRAPFFYILTAGGARMKYPEDLKYSKNDEWVRVEDNVGTIGISDFAQDQLSDIVYLEVANDIGDEMSHGDNIGTVESVKAASDVYMPISGKLLEINDALMDTPEVINSDPYGEGWIIKVEMSDTAELADLFDFQAYQENTKARE